MSSANCVFVFKMRLRNASFDVNVCLNVNSTRPNVCQVQRGNARHGVGRHDLLGDDTCQMLGAHEAQPRRSAASRAGRVPRCGCHGLHLSRAAVATQLRVWAIPRSFALTRDAIGCVIDAYRWNSYAVSMHYAMCNGCSRTCFFVFVRDARSCKSCSASI